MDGFEKNVLIQILKRIVPTTTVDGVKVYHHSGDRLLAEAFDLVGWQEYEPFTADAE